jgi:hypothetical protein
MVCRPESSFEKKKSLLFIHTPLYPKCGRKNITSNTKLKNEEEVENVESSAGTKTT